MKADPSRSAGYSESEQAQKPYSLPLTSRAAPDTRSPLVIAIANQKGGVAKTTTVVSLGGALARRGLDVLMIDLDAQANLTLALGKDPSRVRSSISDVLFNQATLLNVSRETTIPGLDLIPANASMQLAERFLPVRKEHELLLRRAIRDAASSSLDQALQDDRDNPSAAPISSLEKALMSPHIPYEFIILDCPPFIGAVTLNALAAANLLIIPTQPEFFSAHALHIMMETVRQVRNDFNPDLIYRILITMFDRRNRIHRQIEEQIRTTFAQGVFNTRIEIDTKLRESAIEGLPITHHKKGSRSALQYDALAEEIISYVA